VIGTRRNSSEGLETPIKNDKNVKENWKGS
jgi:hypothetical protein